MIQRVFYADLGPTSAERPAWDLTVLEHFALWPLTLLFVVMGVASPYFTRALNPLGVHYAGVQPVTSKGSRLTQIELPKSGWVSAYAVETGTDTRERHAAALAAIGGAH